MKVFLLLLTWLKPIHCGIILWAKLFNLARLLTWPSTQLLVEMILQLLRLLLIIILSIETHQLSNCQSKLSVNQWLQLQMIRLPELFQAQSNNHQIKRSTRNTLNKMAVWPIDHIQPHSKETLNWWPKNSQK